jgi:hypothetical protein
MENVFDALCSALTEPSIKSLFLASEGIDLMALMMKYVSRSCLVIYLMRHAGRNFNLVRGPSRLWTMPCQAPQAALAVKLLLRHWV